MIMVRAKVYLNNSYHILQFNPFHIACTISVQKDRDSMLDKF